MRLLQAVNSSKYGQFGLKTLMFHLKREFILVYGFANHFLLELLFAFVLHLNTIHI